jgi:FkbM family methyltransferase
VLAGLRRSTKLLRKSVRRVIARPSLQQPFRMLYRFALAGMNYGGAGSYLSAGDELALGRVAQLRRDAVIFDVGANIGSYTKQALEICGDGVVIHAFEPSASAFERLQKQFGNRPNVHLSRAGIGARAGRATLFSSEPGSVLASIHGSGTGEEIEIVTLDAYCEMREIERIDLLKLDLEGGELDALRGAERLLAANQIELVQFEFGEPSLGARTYFRDIFKLLSPRFAIYRVLPAALERIDAYNETLEVFMSTNYLAIKSTG